MSPVHPQKTAQRAAKKLENLRLTLDTVTETITADEWLHLRAEIGQLTAEFNAHLGQIDRTLNLPSGRARIIRYLLLRTGETVTKEQLRGVAGIHEGTRRLRELREDHGWPIHSATTRPDMRVGDYLLASDKPDPTLIKTWAAAKAARKLKTAGGTPPAKTRILAFLKSIHPDAAAKDQLAHVAQTHNGAVAALQDLAQDGWDIETFPGDDALNPGGAQLKVFDRTPRI